MGFWAESWWTELTVALSVAVAAIYIYFSHCYKYWQKKGVPYVEPTFPFGIAFSLMIGTDSIGTSMAKAYRQLKGNPFGGVYFFNRPGFVILDPELIKTILVKDFWTFTDRGIPFDESEPLNYHLFFLSGNKWRKLRVKLSPTFTSGKMKMMFQIVADCGREMAAVLEPLASRREAVEMRELAARYATDIIASVAFGIDVNCQRNPESSFRQWGRKVFAPNKLAALVTVLDAIYPKLSAKIGVKDNTSGISEYFQKTVRETVKYREENNITRNDFMHLMIQLKNKGFIDSDKGSEENYKSGDHWKLSIDDVAAQAFVFFLAGFETSSTTISFAIHELALHQNIQRRLQQEIDEVLKKNNGELTYDAIHSMSYLDRVVSETLRKYPPVPILNRKCNADYKIPDSDVVLPKDTDCVIPVLGLHHDPEYYPHPEKFDPDRFTEEEKAKRHPYAYLPFGEGPRICIGMRFGLVQTKAGLVHLLSNFNIEPCEETVREHSYEPRVFVLMPKGGVKVRLTKRKEL